MSENEIKELLHKSVIKTSDGFTDQLMHKVEQRKKRNEKYNFYFVASSVVCLAILPLVSRLLLTEDIFPFQISASPILIRVVGSIGVFLVLYKLIVLRAAALKPE